MATRATADPRDEALRLTSAIRALVHRFSVSERADVSCCGMTVAQAATLEALGTLGPMRLGELGRRLGIQPSTLTRNLARLEQRRFVRRIADADDARAISAVLTEAGRAASRRVRRQDLAFARAVLDRLPAGRRSELLASLEAVLEAIRDETRACCPEAFDHLTAQTTRARSRQRRVPA